jgi:hypothetical protein
VPPGLTEGLPELRYHPTSQHTVFSFQVWKVTFVTVHFASERDNAPQPPFFPRKSPETVLALLTGA